MEVNERVSLLLIDVGERHEIVRLQINALVVRYFDDFGISIEHNLKVVFDSLKFLIRYLDLTI